MSTTRELEIAEQIIDGWYVGPEDERPVSLIIDTIAALIAYGTERELAERGRCAGIADEHDTDCIGCYTAREIAVAIREGKPQPVPEH